MNIRKLAALLLMLVGTQAHAATVFTATMAGANEVPPNASTATGFSTVTIDGNSMIVDMQWDNLVGGTPAAAHLHCCAAPGVNAGVAVGFLDLPTTVSGSYQRTFDLLDMTIYGGGFLAASGGTAAGAQAALIAGMTAGQSYTNIHNAVYPGGEIRGQLAVVATPEPGTLALLALGLMGIGLVRRQRA